MATAATQQANRLKLAQARRPLQSPPAADATDELEDASPNRGAALRFAQSLATGQRNKNASLDKQLVGEAAARAGQALGTYLGGVGGILGKRLGRLLGENYRLVVVVTLAIIGLWLLLYTIGFLIIISTFQSFFS